ncbi:MAG: diguanylate cyclase [candidate division Zixibacteria bacterium]|nr:diguanylate cyclase [candidate division Zixibacteria bacterium]
MEELTVKSTPTANTKKRKSGTNFHCALIQRGTAVEDRILRSIKPYNVIIHKFASIDELYTHGQRVMLEMIVIAGSGPTSWMMELLPRIKRDSALQFVPVVLFHPGPEKDVIIEAYQRGVDEVITNFWDFELVTAKMEMLIARSKRDLGVNPTTRLPGPAAIEHEINIRLKNGENIAVCYGDLDNFKAYNDYYGYIYGDKIILITSHIIRTTVHDLVPNGFVGHIGGDDYIFVIPLAKVDIVCKNILSTFDKMIPFRYKEEDRERGYIDVANRMGEMERFPLMTLSIAAIPNQDRAFTHVGEMSHMMADLKKYTKTQPGSNYMIERRKKY